ncbi:MFS transporter [Micromonospora siamensis]|uniref:Drug resistance transporter, EmrB/QacA subfamily n=1 Tax=Micromonospora siamensis TaxID=299152 RepID=A0A1C5HXR2_9ACTN|nr:MFS transporter [Micromonospora siamensis]SCG50381.1 drug resistance transporter, EmrB/QacA subfamily [Micromonospora siamensis]
MAGTERETFWRHWGVLAVILCCDFMITLDFFIVNVAIPSMQTDLRANSAAVQFIVAGYGLAYASGLITWGRLGDMRGRRRMFTLGIVLFTIASAACGLAPTAGALVAARIAQGLSAALMAPQVLAILGIVYIGADRARAFAVAGLGKGLAAVFGQLIGGLLIQADAGGLGWRLCFLINVPVGVAVLVAAPRVVPESRAGGRTSLDLVGTVLVASGLVAAVLPLVEGRRQGWPPWSWLCLAAAVPLLAAFAAHQRRLTARGGQPLVDTALFRGRAFTVGVVTTLLYYAGMGAFLLVLALCLQQGYGLSALHAGLVCTAIGVGFFAATLAGPALTRTLGRQAVALGALALAGGWLILAVTVGGLGPDGDVVLLTPALLVCGVGMGLIMAQLTSMTLAGIGAGHAGAASGVLNTAVQIGSAIGVALIGIVFYGATEPAGTGAVQLSLLCLTGVGLTIAALVQLLPRATGRGAPHHTGPPSTQR